MMRLIKYISRDNGRAVDFIEITMRLDFKEGIEKLRAKWNIDPDLLTGDDKETEYEWLRLLENPDIRDDARTLVTQLKLSHSWDDLVHQHLVDDTLFSYNSKEFQISKNTDGLSLERNTENVDDIILRVGPATTFADLKIAWKEIENLRKNTPKKRKRGRELYLRDLKIFRLAEEGKSASEISTIMEKEGYKVDIGNIKKIVSSFYERLKTPKKERKKLRT